MGFLKFLFISVLIMYVIRLLIRLVLPVFLNNAVNKMSGQQQQQQRKPEGKISIDYMPPQSKTGNADKLGDFVDYEEMK